MEDMGGGRRHTAWHAAEWPPSCYGELIRSPSTAAVVPQFHDQADDVSFPPRGWRHRIMVVMVVCVRVWWLGAWGFSWAQAQGCVLEGEGMH